MKGLSNIQGLYVHDFEDLFNCIYLTDLKNKIFDFFKRHNILGKNLDHLTNLFNFVVNENYLFDGKHVFQRIRDIPMGGEGSCSSVLADIYLFLYEVNETLNTDFLSFRYIDDVLLVRINDSNSDLNLNYYPQGLTLKKTSYDEKHVNYLNLTIDIERGGLSTCIYDKSKDYNFETIKILNFNSDVHNSIFRNIIINSLIRIAKLNSNHNSIINDIINLYQDAMVQNYPISLLNSLRNNFVKDKDYRDALCLAIKNIAK